MSGIDNAQGSGGSPELHRRDLLLAAGTTIALGLDAAASKTKADIPKTHGARFFRRRSVPTCSDLIV
jgi:hypothetical protein